MGNDYVAPADADELYRRDGDYILGFARKYLNESGNYQDAEDVASDIVEHLLMPSRKTGLTALEQYDPDTVSDHTKHNVTWRAFLSHKVELYLRGKREQVVRRTSREPLQCDAPVGEDGERWIELFGTAHEDEYPSLTDDEFVSRIRGHLATLPDTYGGRASAGDTETWSSQPGGVSLLAAFDEIRESVVRTDKARVESLKRVDSRQALETLRAVVRGAAAAPEPGKFDVQGVILDAAEMRDAIDKLRAGKGNHVHVPLRDHRLQLEGPPKWYHPFSAAERKLYPECTMDPKTHARPADHVKRAVIHRLERMLAEAGHLVERPEDPEPEVTRDELLEAELWKIKGMTTEQVDAVLDAVRRVGS